MILFSPIHIFSRLIISLPSKGQMNDLINENKQLGGLDSSYFEDFIEL